MNFANFLTESVQDDIKTLSAACVRAYSGPHDDFVASCMYLSDFVNENCRNYHKAEEIKRSSTEQKKAEFLPVLRKAAITGFVAFGGLWKPKLNTALKLFARMPASDVIQGNDPILETFHFSVAAYAIIREGVINDCIARQMCFDEWSDGEGMSRYAELSPDKIIIDLTRQPGQGGKAYCPKRDREQIWLMGSWEQQLRDALAKGTTNTMTLGENIRNSELSPTFWSFIMNNFGKMNDYLGLVNDLEYFYV